MANFICLQAGHEGRTTGATGAPGEQELNVRIRNRLSEVLISKDFMVQLVNADPTGTEINKDFDLFLSIHGDADVYGTGGGLVDHPEPSTDGATLESQRIDTAIESMYFQHSEIVNHPERSNANTRYYYMWSRLTAKTPCVLIELGVVQDAHDKVLLADTDRITNALARGICTAFNVPFDTTPVNSCPADLELCRSRASELEIELTKWKGIVYAIKNICYGKGWVWQKLANIKSLLTQNAI